MIFDIKRFYVLCRLSTTALVSNVSDSRIEIREKSIYMIRSDFAFYAPSPSVMHGINGFQISVIILVKQRCHKQALIVCVGVKWFLFNHLSLILIQLRIQEQTEMPLGTIPTLNSQIRHFSKNHEKFSKSGIFDLVFPGRQRSEGKKYKLL